MPGAEVFDWYPDRYDSWFEGHPGIYAAELRALGALRPESARGLEIGVGCGRFASPLPPTERGEAVREGYGQGLFVVIKAGKP
jgi:hypothetical protein